VPRLKAGCAHAKEKFSNMQIACRIHAYENGIDKPEIRKLERAVLTIA
jgi:xylulose-5-phosphate/fructose-6-phosphate phosphoketolase